MAINLTKVGVAVGVGALDEFLERQDNSKGRAGFKRWSAIARGVLAIGGFAGGNFLGKYADIGETAGIAATPLFVKTLAESFPMGGGKTQDFAARDVGARIRNWVPSGDSYGGYRPLT